VRDVVDRKSVASSRLICSQQSSLSASASASSAVEEILEFMSDE
jgi:hypothetical protein